MMLQANFFQRCFQRFFQFSSLQQSTGEIHFSSRFQLYLCKGVLFGLLFLKTLTACALIMFYDSIHYLRGTFSVVYLIFKRLSN